jgi:hypothetical protein
MSDPTSKLKAKLFILERDPPRHLRVYPEPLAYIEGDKTRPAKVRDLLDVAEDIYATVSEALEQMGAPPLTRRAGGRPAKEFVTKLAVFGAAWLAANGVPHSQADLVRALEERCDERGWEYGSTQVRAMAAELIAEFKAQLES